VGEHTAGPTVVKGHDGGGTRPVWVTSVTDWLEHAVTVDAMESALATSRPQPMAVCGVTLLPAALVEPPGRRCWRCEETLAPRKPNRRGGRRARPSTWRRLLGLLPRSHQQ
jgi:hypothetical protein